MAASRLKRFRRELRVRALLIALKLLQFLPYDFATSMGAALGWLGYYATARQRNLALEHLAIAFPEKSLRLRKRIARACFAHLGRAAIEAAQADKLDIVQEVRLDPQSEKVIRDAHSQGKGIVVATAHIGNWDLFGRRIASLGIPAGTVAKEAQDPRLTELLTKSRAGIQLFWRGSPMSARGMIRFLKSGGILGVLIDQDTRVAGHFVPFFGRPAFTPRAAADLSLRLEAPMIFAVANRLAPRLHELTVRLIEVQRSGDLEADSIALTAAATAAIEAQIRAKPAQWVWMHPRWRTQTIEMST